MKTLHDFYRLFPSHPVLAAPTSAPARAPVLATVAAPLPIRVSSRYRERDFGTGYGRSSGYARDARYTAPHDDRLLRVC